MLQKDRADIEAAAYLLETLCEMLPPIEDDDDLLSARAHRLRGRTLIRLGEERGRETVLGVFEQLGGTSAATASSSFGLRERFLSDLCGDLMLLGLYDTSIEVGTHLATFDDDPTAHALNLGNLGAWHLQRAVIRRRLRLIDDAITDLDIADRCISSALSIWVDLSETNALHWREARAVQLSITIERSFIDRADLTAAIDGLKELLRDSLPLPRDETYLQMLYRIGRLGTAHLHNASYGGRGGAAAAARARAYLDLAWRTSGNACIRPWVAFYLLDALAVSGDQEALGRFRTEAVRRLRPQFGAESPVIALLTSGFGRPPDELVE